MKDPSYFTVLTPQKCKELENHYAKYEDMAKALNKEGHFCTAANVRYAFKRHKIDHKCIYERVEQDLNLSSYDIAIKHNISFATVYKYKNLIRKNHFHDCVKYDYSVDDRYIKLYVKGHTRPSICSFISGVLQFYAVIASNLNILRDIQYGNDKTIEYIEVYNRRNALKNLKSLVEMLDEISRRYPECLIRQR